MDHSIVLIDADISNCATLPEADFIIHAAASTDAKDYLMRPEVEKRNIQAGTYNYCTLAKAHHGGSKIVYCSSGAVYGQQPLYMPKIPESFSIGLVNSLPQGKQDYAVAKRDAEIAIQELGFSGLSVSIARCFAFVGKYLPRDQHFAIGNFIDDGIHGRPILVKAQHEVFRSYMYSDDLVIWLMTIASSASPGCPIFNVGSDEAIEIRDMARNVAKHFGVSVEASSIISPDEVDTYIPDTNKAKTLLGLELKYNLEAAINSTIEGARIK